MKNNKVITMVTIIAVIAIAGTFFGVNHLIDTYVNQQRASQSGNQASVSGQAAAGQAVSPAYGMIMVTMDAPEESGVCGETLEWYYKDEVLVITGTGEMDEYIPFADDAPWDSLKSQIGCVILDEGVMSIGGAAFQDCVNMTEIVLPLYLTYIDDNAFFGCSSLLQIELPDGVIGIGESAFEGCSSLRNIVIPDGVTSIGDRAFSYCSKLRKIILPDSVTRIDKETFFGCINLQKIVIPDGITSIGDYAFCSCGMMEITI
ncbi:MAG: leucine-rich repeat domain-containing protein, partial [Lachnospiraceae bacterium]|nr:leucine-rich repeat domain-containing protein [Lachnospiraceae bacterium]